MNLISNLATNIQRHEEDRISLYFAEEKLYLEETMDNLTWI